MTTVTHNFKRLVGVWKTEGIVTTDQGQHTLSGTDTYALILGENFMLHTAAVRIGAEKNETHEVMRLSDCGEEAEMHYFNSKKENGIMNGSLKGQQFQIHGDKIKFEGILNDNDTKITGKWYSQNENGQWNVFIEMQLTRI